MSALDGWRTMEAGRALDRVVAERLGYPTHTTDIPDAERNQYAPSVTMLYWMRVNGIPLPLVRYSTDANAALSLPLDEGTSLRLFSPDDDSPDEWEAVCCKGSRIERAFAPAPALAVCRAWLAYQDSKSQAST